MRQKMRSWLGCLCLLSVIGPLLSEYVITQDITYEYLRKFINHSVDPCENFYDHVCPFGLQKEDAPMWGIVSPSLLKRLEAQTKVSALEKAFQAELAAAASQAEADETRMRLSVVGGLRMQPVFYNYLQSLNVDIDEKMQLLSDEIRHFTDTIVDQLRKTSLSTMDNSTIQQLVEYELTQVVKLTEETIPIELMQLIYEALTSAYNRLIRKGHFTPKEALKFMDSIVTAVYWSNPDLYNLVGSYATANSLWDGYTRTVNLFHCVSLSYINTTRVAVWGKMMTIIGHELIHPIVDRSAQVAQNDPHVLANRQCMNDYLNKAFAEFGPDENHGRPLDYEIGDVTAEAIPDYEGLQAAYLSYKKEFEGKGKEIAYSDLGITNDQLFFYAAASNFCVVDELRSRSQYDHPPFFLRVNSMMPLMDGYLEAFKCKPEQKMYKIRNVVPKDKCNFFGQVTKKVA